MKTSGPRRKRRWLPIIGVAVLLVVGAAFGVLRLKLQGPALAESVAELLNKRMRGRIEIGSIEWSTSALKTAVTGGWIGVTIRDVRVWDDCALSAAATGEEGERLRAGDPNEDCTPDDRPDPDPSSKRKPRKLLLRTDRVSAEIDAHAAMFGNHDLVFRNVWVHGGDGLLEQTTEPYPLHAYDRTIISIVSAFYPREKPGFRAGIYADSPPPIFDLRDFHVAGLNLTLHMAPSSGATPDQVSYGFTGRLENVNVDAGPNPKNDSYLHMDAKDPLLAKFYVRLSVTAERGKIRIVDEGMRTAFRLAKINEPWPPPGRSQFYEIELADIRLDRLAQLPTEWAKRAFVANTLELDLHARTLPCTPAGAAKLSPQAAAAAGADLHLSGELFNYWDRPYDGAWNLKLDAKNLGPTVSTCIKPALGGDNLEGTISLTGPFIAQPAVGLDLKGVDYELALGAEKPPMRLTLAELHGKIDLVNEEGYIEKTKALVQNGQQPGEIELSATFGLKPLYSNAQVEIVKAIDMGAFLPPRAARSVGKYLHGRLRAIGDTEKGFELTDLDLALGQTPRDAALRVHHGRLFTNNNFGAIHIEKVYVDAGKSHAMLDGAIDIEHEQIGLKIFGDFPDLDAWLAKFDIPALVKSAGAGVVELTGKLSQPTITVNTTLAGVPCIDQLKLENLRKEGDVITVQRMSSPGLGGQLAGNARITLGAQTRIDKLELKGQRLDAAKICNMKGVLKGTVDELDVQLRGTIDPRRPPLEWLGLGQIYARADKISILDDRYTGLAACVNRKDDARCRPQVSALTEDDRAQCDAGKRASATNGGGFCLVASASRDAGGKLDAMIAQLPRAAKAKSPTLAGAVAVTELPLAIIDQLRGLPAAHGVGGVASLVAHLQGTPAAPQAVGQLALMRSWIADGFLGDAQIAIEPATVRGVPGLQLRGAALAGRLEITGLIGTAAPFPVELKITARRVEVDPFLDLQAMLGLPDRVQAWATGTITVQTELAPVRPADPEAWIELSELRLQVDRRGTDGRITPMVVQLKDSATKGRAALSVHATPSSYELACRDPKAPRGRAACSVVLATPAGDIEIEGHARRPLVAMDPARAKLAAPSADPEIELTARGILDIGELRGFFENQFDRVSGYVGINASVTGPFARPAIQLALDLAPELTPEGGPAPDAPSATTLGPAVMLAGLRGAMGGDAPRGESPVTLRPVGSDTVLSAPRGKIELANGTIGFTNVQVRVHDERRTETQGELNIAGTIKLDGFKPLEWTLLLSGSIPGKLLEVVAPGGVAQADGLIDIDGQLQLTGKGLLPQVSGTLLFNHFTVLPRALHKEIALNEGSVEISTDDKGHRAYSVDIVNANGTFDEGQLTNLAGTVQLTENGLESVRLRLDGSGLRYRIPKLLDLNVAASNIELTYGQPNRNWRVTGTVTLVDGAYLRDFEITDRIQAIGVNSAASAPVWDAYPMLGEAQLDLTMVVQLFALRNNIATVAFRSDGMRISGSPREPRLSGSIRVTHGVFRFPGTRASFTRTNGTVDFAENQPASNPELNVTTDADYRDLSGQEHVITATIAGTLQLPTWDLKTSTGYNKSQTLSLLVLGRNQEQLRRSLGDSNLGGDPTRVDPTTNPSQGFADQIVKDLAGEWVSDLLGSSLTKLTGLDVLRIEIGFGSIGFHVEKRMLENVKLLGDAEQTIRGTTIKGKAELQTPYPISLEAGYLNQNYYDPAEQDIQDVNLKLVYRVFP